MTPEALLAGLSRNPDCLLQDLDLVNRRGLLVALREVDYRNASFLDHRALKPDTAGAWFPLPMLLQQATAIQPTTPAHFIFHVSHCGSTLVSRLLAELPGCLPLREPLPILSLSQARRELALPASRLDGPGWDALFDLSLRLASRGYRTGERTVLKATSVCANLLAPLSSRSHGSHALLLYTDLETWLTTMLRDEKVRENGRYYAPAWLTDFMAITGHADLRLAAMTDAEQFALNWLTGMLHFQRALAAAPERTLLCDFEGFLAEPAAALRKTAGFFGLDASRAEEAASGPLMRSYAKNPAKPYDREQRRQELKLARNQVGGEIDAGLAYAEKLTQQIPALMPLASHFRRSA
ncbi:MAG: hypothetical protein ACHQAU_02990 [Gammaproteobacteria bacterium]